MTNTANTDRRRGRRAAAVIVALVAGLLALPAGAAGADPPDAPAAPEVIVRSSTVLEVYWDSPSDGGSAITAYTVSACQYGEETVYATDKPASPEPLGCHVYSYQQDRDCPMPPDYKKEDRQSVDWVCDPLDNTVRHYTVLSGLSPLAESYRVQVRATNGDGLSDWSLASVVTDVTRPPPDISGPAWVEIPYAHGFPVGSWSAASSEGLPVALSIDGGDADLFESRTLHPPGGSGDFVIEVKAPFYPERTHTFDVVADDGRYTTRLTVTVAVRGASGPSKPGQSPSSGGGSSGGGSSSGGSSGGGFGGFVAASTESESSSDLGVCPAVDSLPFNDVDASGALGEAVACLYGLEITEGVSEDAYGPDETVTRGQMALFLSRLWEASGGDCPSARSLPFGDVDASGPLREAVACLYGLEITEGVSEDAYGPGEAVTRGQMALFLSRLWEAFGGTCPSRSIAPFGDVDASGAVGEAVGCLYVLGITEGVSAGVYGPDETVSRGQMALFLSRFWEQLPAQ